MLSDNKAKTFSRDHSVDVSLNQACRNAGERRELSARTPGLNAFSDQIAHFGAGDFCFAFAHDIGGTVTSVEDVVDASASAGISNEYRIIIAADRMVPIGFAMFIPAISGAEP